MTSTTLIDDKNSAKPAGASGEFLAEAQPRVTFIGTLPPPVTGMTAMTEVIVDELRRHGPVTVFNWSPGKPLKGWRWRIARAWGVFKTLVRLPLLGRGRGAVIYYPVSSSGGLYYDLAIIALARMLGYRAALHHHSYSYISRRDWRVGALNRLIGSSGAHVVHCSMMEQHFRKYYDSSAQFLHVPPTIVSQQLNLVEAEPRATFTLGFLSNLTMTKGLDEAIDTFVRLAGQGQTVRLVLAGPCLGRNEQRLIDRTLAAWPDGIEYRGPIYGHAKALFFADIDAFLFPTRYRNESWGIVLTEALAAGLPVIARDRGCVPWIVRNGCGTVVDDASDFASIASDLIGQWISDPRLYQQAQAAARRQSGALNEDAQRELPKFIDQLRAMGQPRA